MCGTGLPSGGRVSLLIFTYVPLAHRASLSPLPCHPAEVAFAILTKALRRPAEEPGLGLGSKVSVEERGLWAASAEAGVRRVLGSP